MIANDTSVQATAATRAQVKHTLQQSGMKSGKNFGYLLKVANGESSFQAGAKSKTSSASGVFQFTEQTWLQMMKTHGAKYGLAQQAGAIQIAKGGRHEVPDAATRKAILAQRHDPKLATQMATELASDNRKFLEKRLGRTVTEGEVYAAHFFGGSGALRMIQTRAATPDQAGDQVLPAAARSNRNIFYDRTTNAPNSTRQIMARLDGVVASKLADASGPPPRKPAVGLLSNGTSAALMAYNTR